MSGETQVEVKIHHSHPSMGDPMSKLSLSSAGLHSSGGSTGEDSSGEEPPHVVLPKKIRLKESNISINSNSTLLSMICGNREHLMDEDGDEMDGDDNSDGPTMKDGGMANSLTSGEVTYFSGYCLLLKLI
jgi:hypothetical protein